MAARNCGPDSKTVGVGMKERVTTAGTAQMGAHPTRPTLQGFVPDRTAPGAPVYTAEGAGCCGLPNHATEEAGWPPPEPRPDHIPDTPENIRWAGVSAPPKKRGE